MHQKLFEARKRGCIKSKQPWMCYGLRLLTVRSPSTYRKGLLDTWIFGFFGSGVRVCSDFSTNIVCYSSTRTFIEEATGDALKLMHLGSTTGDQRILLQARTRHLAGVQALRMELQTTADPNTIFSAAQKLLLYEVYSHGGSDPHTWDTWNGHVRGMAAIVQASANTRTIHSFLLRQFRHVTLMQSILYRRPMVDENVWQACSEAPLSSIAESLTQLALRLPTLLEKASHASRRSGSETDHATAIEISCRLLDLDSDFASWYGVFSDTRKERPLCAGSPLDLTYQFFYWTCVLILRQALLDLSERIPEGVPEQKLFVENAECANHLCRMVSFGLEASRGLLNTVFILGVPLRVLSDWFERAHESIQLQWCREQEMRLREEFPLFDWNAVLPWSFLAMYYLA